MRLRLSRHARNNMRLYGITEENVKNAINLPDEVLSEGERQVVIRLYPAKFSGLPIKVVFVKENDGILVITTYPLKASYRRK